MTHWNMYWFTRLDTFNDFAWTCGILLVIVGAILVACVLDDGISWIFPAATLVPGMLLILVGLFLPTQKEAAAIWLVPKMVNNEKLNNIASNTLSIVDEYTKEYLAELLEKEGSEATSPGQAEQE